jgi:CMP-N-acetylneuraminic acid synthetase/spore coat polysaccharide biosynthesis predicted glycosyltransferase SpsG
MSVTGPRTLVVIPARWASKGIPRKNLCPIGGKPLMAWAIQAALAAESVTRVVVSTDSESIATVARRWGAGVVMRPSALGKDAVTLDPVIHDAVLQEEAQGRRFDVVATIQPTSPLLRTSTLERILQRLNAEQVDTILTAADDTHLAWQQGPDGPTPAYQERLNRQQLPPRFRETGGVLATRRQFVTPTSRFGKRVDIEVLSGFESLDIDTREDWLTAEAALGRRRIAFITIGNRAQGLGHVTRTLTLLESFNGHIVQVLCTPEQDLAIDKLRAAFYEPVICPAEQMLDHLDRFSPDVVVHDQLETAAEQIQTEVAAGYRVVLFEDGGPAQQHAHLVFNALFDESGSEPERGRWCGPQVYCLRDEFTDTEPAPFNPTPQRVLITFGGTDPAGLTFKVLSAVAQVLQERAHKRQSVVGVTVVAGRGFADFDALQHEVSRLEAQGLELRLLQDVPLMSEVMSRADIAFSSAGRTLYELSHMQVPTIVLAQNAVEQQHTFAALQNGFLYLGLGSEVETSQIRISLSSLLDDPMLRAALKQRMQNTDLTRGRIFVPKKILEFEP